MFTAIGWETKYKGFGAIEVATKDKDEVQRLLTEAFGVEFETIVLMKNGNEAPEVVEYWEV